MGDERVERLKRIRKYMISEIIDISIIFSKENIYYLTGFNTPGSPNGQALIITEKDNIIVSRKLEVSNANPHPLIKDKSNGYEEGEDPIKHLVNNIKKYPYKKIG